MSTTRVFWLLSLPLALLLAPGAARADDAKKDAPAAAPAAGSEDASQRFRSGVAFYKDKNFAAALVEFKRAYELVPNYSVLFNLGQTARELKDYAAALKAFEQYLNEGGTKVPPARRKDVTASVEDLRQKVGKIKLVTSVDGAEVSLDDVVVGVSPLSDALVVNVGRRKLSATLSGYTPAQRVVDVAGMAETTVTLDLPKIETAPPPVEAPVVPPPKPETPVVVWAALGGTGALAIAAGVTGGLALSARGALNQALATFPGNPKAISAAQGRTRTFALATDVLGGVTIAGAAATVVLYMLAPRSVEKAKVSVDVSPTGVGLRGVF